MRKRFLIFNILLLWTGDRCWGLFLHVAKRRCLPLCSRGNEYDDYESYSRCLAPKQELKSVLRESNEYAIVDRESFSKRISRALQSVLRRRVTQTPGKLILLVNGESTWNANHTFTGWEDPPLTEKGILLCQHAARILIAEGLQPDIVYTSKLKRAIQSVQTILDESDAWYVPVVKTYRLNARMYGAVQALSKRHTAEKLGANVVQAWRNTLKARPPPLLHSDPASPANNRRYKSLVIDEIPEHESIFDCHERARAVWSHRIKADIAAGHTVLVVAHRDALRGIMKEIDDIPDGMILDVTIPVGVPLLYQFDANLKPAARNGVNSPSVSSALYLDGGKEDHLVSALEKDSHWRMQFDSGPSRRTLNAATTIERALWQLRQDEQLVSQIHKNFSESRNVNVLSKSVADDSGTKDRWVDDPTEAEDFEFFSESNDKMVGRLMPDMPIPNVVPIPTNNDHANDTVVVFVRHGRTPHNNMGLFTGFQDPPLAEEGIEDAKQAGRLLRRHGFEFDVVYTSQLTRAIQTGTHILDELDSLWVPMVKSWRLNERMYGSLTGKSKRMIENEYGKEQLKKWRRGYKIRPPKVSSFSPDYPGNDERRIRHITDIRYSWTESMARSLEQRKLVLHRKFPKSESLFDCMQRTIPFYTDRILPEAVAKQRRVLIASHENAIRGILMYLCDIPEQAMQQLHIPNGVPLVYNVKGKCISLLDDDLTYEDGRPKTTVSDFGPAAKYLFKPCMLDEDFFGYMASTTRKAKNNEVSAN